VIVVIGGIVVVGLLLALLALIPSSSIRAGLAFIIFVLACVISAHTLGTYVPPDDGIDHVHREVND
jgi:hypothetical protein